MTKGNLRKSPFWLTFPKSDESVKVGKAWQQAQEAERLYFNYTQEAKKNWKWGEATSPQSPLQ